MPPDTEPDNLVPGPTHRLELKTHPADIRKTFGLQADVQTADPGQPHTALPPGQINWLPTRLGQGSDQLVQNPEDHDASGGNLSPTRMVHLPAKAQTVEGTTTPSQPGAQQNTAVPGGLHPASLSP